MENFIEKRNEYFKKLKSNPNVLNKIIEDNKGKEKSKRTLEVLLTPKDEFELELANTMYDYICDFLNIYYAVIEEEIDEIPYEDNLFFSYLINIINAYKNNEDTDSIIKSISMPGDCAKMVLHMYLGFLFDIESAYEYIAEKCGFDIYDELELEQFNIYLEKVQFIINQNSNFNTVPDELNKDNLEFFKEFYKEFHILYENIKTKGERSLR